MKQAQILKAHLDIWTLLILELRLTTESDTYSFGVVLLEVLCGRPAVEPLLGEDKRSLTMWAREIISKGQLDHIIDPCLREEISADSLKTFVKVADKCLLDEPNKRPAMAHVVMNLQFALEQQDHAESFVHEERARITEILKDMISSLPNERPTVTEVAPHANIFQREKSKSLLPKDEIRVADDRTNISASRRLTEASSNVQKKNLTSILREKSSSIMISSARKFERKSMMHKLSRNFLPLYVLWKTGKSSKKNDVVDHSLSAPIQRRSSYMTLRRSAVSRNSRFSEANVSPDGQVLPQPPNLKVYKYSELKIATRNFRLDTMLGEGGFGKVFKGWVDGKPGSGTVVAVKKLNSQSLQGFQEWQSEVNFLGSLSHPNLVRLLGYCWEDKELLLVYEFMQKGSLENHLFGRGSHVQPLPWDIRLKILIGAAHGLAFLHAQDKKVIYRDFKASNILLNGFTMPSYLTSA